MKQLLSILLISTLFAGELEVDGDLTVTGNIQNQTIDSLLQVIADLQSQLSALQVENKLETRVYELPRFNFDGVTSMYLDLSHECIGRFFLLNLQMESSTKNIKYQL